MNLRVRGERDDGPEATDRRVGGVARSLVCVGVCSGLEAPTRTRGWCVPLCETVSYSRLRVGVRASQSESVK